MLLGNSHMRVMERLAPTPLLGYLSISTIGLIHAQRNLITSRSCRAPDLVRSNNVPSMDSINSGVAGPVKETFLPNWSLAIQRTARNVENGMDMHARGRACGATSRRTAAFTFLPYRHW